MLSKETEYLSTLGCKDFLQQYSKYTVNASQAGERVMSYAEYLECYQRVCPSDIRMLVESVNNTYRLVGF